MDNTALTILIVEDNDDDLFLIQRAIRKSRLANPISVVRDGQQAIRYLAGEDEYSDRVAHPLPMLVLLDLHMPKQNGFGVLNWLRVHPELRTLKVAVLTASPNESDYQRAIRLGADSYFVKPGCLDEFVGLMLRIQGAWLLLDSAASSSQNYPRERKHLLAAKTSAQLSTGI